jgi:hypothetical protein
VTAREARSVQALSGLEPVHYREAFAVAVDTDRRPEEWARLLMEGAYPRKRRAMLRAWRILGVKLRPLGSPHQVLGWRIELSDSDVVVLAAESWSGLTVRLVLAASPQRVVHTMVVRFDRPYAGLLWRVVAARHRAFVRGLLLDLRHRTIAQP